MVRKCSKLRIPLGSRRNFRSCDNEVYQLHNRFLIHCFSCTDLWPVSPASVWAPVLHEDLCMHKPHQGGYVIRSMSVTTFEKF